MTILFPILIFLFGASIGSFINVVADRYNTGLSFLKGSSICFNCNTPLKALDLIPIFSFLFLRGKCRHCSSKIPYSTVLVELIMGMLTLLAAAKTGILPFSVSIIHNSYFIIQFLLLTLIFGNLLLITIYDLKHFIIPDSFLVALSIFVIIFNGIIHNPYFIIQSLIPAIILPLPFLILFLVSKGRLLGLGDVKYMFVIGLFLGFAMGISALVLAFWLGALTSLLLLALRKQLTIKSEVPFGPFLSFGIIVSFIFNADLFQIHSFLSLLFE